MSGDDLIEGELRFVQTQELDIAAGEVLVRKSVAPGSDWRPAVDRLSREFLVLQCLRGVDGVPAAVRFDPARGELTFRAIEGRTLSECKVEGRLQWSSLVHVALSALRVLEAIHARGVLHLDINPRCLRLHSEPGSGPTRFKVIITSFGHAVFPSLQGDLSKLAVRASYPAYGAPEQTGRMNRGIDRRADLYSLGVVLYELACGLAPFAHEDPLALQHAQLTHTPALAHAIKPSVPEPLSRLLARMLRKVPEHRPASATELIAEFKALLLVLDRSPALVGPAVPLAAVSQGPAPAPWPGSAVELASDMLQRFDRAERLDAVEAAVGARVREAARDADAPALATLKTFETFLRSIRDWTEAPPLHMFQVSPPAMQSFDPLEDPVQAGVARLLTCVAAIFHADTRTLARISCDGLCEHFPEESYIAGVSHFASGMATLARLDQLGRGTPERDDALAEVRSHADRLDAFAQRRPRPFATLHHLLHGLSGEASDDHWEAMRRLERALTTIHEDVRVWHRAMALEINGRFCMKHRMSALGRGLLERCMTVYQRWGVDRKLQVLTRDFPFLTLGQPSVSDPDAPKWVSAAERQAMLMALQALSLETDLGQLISRMVEVTEQLAGATAVALFFHDERDGWLLAGARRNGVVVKDVPLQSEFAPRHGFARSIVMYALASTKSEIIGNAVLDSRFADDAALVGVECCSVLIMPILTKGSTRALLLLENRVSASFFSGKDLATLGLIASTLATSIENAFLYRRQEQRGEERALALEQTSAALLLRDRALSQTTNGIMITAVLPNSSPIVYVNSMFEKLLGYSAGQVIGANSRTWFRGDVTSESYDEIAVAVANARSYRVLLERHFDGRHVYLEANMSPIKSKEGKLTNYVAVFTDMTERLERQAIERRKTERLSAVFELSPDGYVVVDKDDCISIVNPAFERMTGLQAIRLIGKSLSTLEALLDERTQPQNPAWTAPSDFVETDRGVPLRPSPKPRVDRQGLLHLNTPQPRTLMRRDSQGELPGGETVLCYRDVTREIEIDQTKSDFLSTAAHELRTPMQSIFGFTELVLQRKLDDDQRQDMLRTIHRQSSSLIAMINELLDLARIGARRGADFQYKPQLLKPIVAQTVDALGIRADDRSVQLRGAALPRWVNVDAEKLGNALTNLLSNAFKYSTRGDVVIEFLTRHRRNREEVGVCVSDEGIGMTPPQLERMFERFFRADTSGRIPGTGLGATLAKEIVELHDGELTAQSQYGVGTSMTIWLPLHEPLDEDSD